MELPCSQKTISIIKRNKFYTSCWLSFSKLPSCFCNRKKKLTLHKKVCEDKDFCNAIMHCKYTKILKSNQCQKPDKAPSIIYTDLECIIEKIDEFKNK